MDVVVAVGPATDSPSEGPKVFLRRTEVSGDQRRFDRLELSVNGLRIVDIAVVNPSLPHVASVRPSLPHGKGHRAGFDH